MKPVHFLVVGLLLFLGIVDNTSPYLNFDILFLPPSHSLIPSSFAAFPGFWAAQDDYFYFASTQNAYARAQCFYASLFLDVFCLSKKDRKIIFS